MIPIFYLSLLMCSFAVIIYILGKIGIDIILKPWKIYKQQS